MSHCKAVFRHKETAGRSEDNVEAIRTIQKKLFTKKNCAAKLVEEQRLI